MFELCSVSLAIWSGASFVKSGQIHCVSVRLKVLWRILWKVYSTALPGDGKWLGPIETRLSILCALFMHVCNLAVSMHVCMCDVRC